MSMQHIFASSDDIHAASGGEISTYNLQYKGSSEYKKRFKRIKKGSKTIKRLKWGGGHSTAHTKVKRCVLVVILQMNIPLLAFWTPAGYIYLV